MDCRLNKEHAAAMLLLREQHDMRLSEVQEMNQRSTEKLRQCHSQGKWLVAVRFLRAQILARLHSLSYAL